MALLTFLLTIGCLSRAIKSIDPKDSKEWLLNAILFLIITVLLAWR